MPSYTYALSIHLLGCNRPWNARKSPPNIFFYILLNTFWHWLQSKLAAHQPSLLDPGLD